MKYTKDQRLDIGRRIYEGELNRFEAAAEYGIGSNTAREYMRLYRAEYLSLIHIYVKFGARAGAIAPYLASARVQRVQRRAVVIDHPVAQRGDRLAWLGGYLNRVPEKRRARRDDLPRG